MSGYVYLKHGFSGANYLAHHGILGQKWGVRRYQNKDGSWTKAGKERYAEKSTSEQSKKSKSDTSIHSNAQMEAAFNKMRNNAKTDEEKDKKVHAWEKARDDDLYEMYFLEAIQNSRMLRDHDDTGMLTEYAKYLDDRMDYMENQGWKLD